MNTGSKVRFLVVDDNLDILEAYTGLLRILGLVVETAVDGSVAWHKLQNSDFDIVLSDVRMPVMDGVELLKKIRERNGQSPCVILTSGFTDYHVHQLFHLGANGFLHKPVNAAAIRKIINKASLSNEERWKQPLHDQFTLAVSLEFSSFDEMVKSRLVRFGNGGFHVQAKTNSLTLNTTIRFSFHFQGGSIPSIEGIGTVPWIHDFAGIPMYGVEIEYLSDQCRVPVCTWLEDQKLKPFIPSGD